LRIGAASSDLLSPVDWHGVTDKSGRIMEEIGLPRGEDRLPAK
jgi:hypothetical protein